MNRTALVPLIDREMAACREARRRGDVAAAWRALEPAHVLLQPLLRRHVAVHFAMLGYSIRLGDPREIGGQLARLVLAPLGAFTGRTRPGNTGRLSFSAFATMPISADFAAELPGAGR